MRSSYNGENGLIPPIENLTSNGKIGYANIKK
ncbi:hypothetical protein J2S10_002035 [Neobacillus ginsengisoli]|uniref:Uncharacterized protein n=1 Tax=Neobacillus ginsengisoli TaxID=904295 RepID=A0ABT9XTI6_9BACI|nr:hypothetical protein [Neobacillus ginsengisoli]